MNKELKISHYEQLQYERLQLKKRAIEVEMNLLRKKYPEPELELNYRFSVLRAESIHTSLQLKQIEDRYSSKTLRKKFANGISQLSKNVWLQARLIFYNYFV